ncbi:MAG: hypothetical protein JXA21_00165 [Anaerolineae bacterium]|nr:hypothetical protein [Anaerolineae bacterium]
MPFDPSKLRWWLDASFACNRPDLEKESKAYWDDQRPRKGDPEPDARSWYIKKLLPKELNYASAHHGMPDNLTCDTLVLLVGHSLEPLLQTISVLEPTQIILLLNCNYNGTPGKQYGKEFKQHIEKHLAPHLSHPLEPVRCELIAETPEAASRPDAVFHALCKHVLPQQAPDHCIVIDITGGKKSMDVGAFLFAAYANIPVVYMDFDTFVPQKRRPWGYTCRLGELKNPYDAFALRDWERVHRAYEHYHFREAIAAFVKLDAQLQASNELSFDLFSPEQKSAMKQLSELLEFYKAWQDGDYYKAHQLGEELKNRWPEFVTPDAVMHLGSHWPKIDPDATASDTVTVLIKQSGNYVTPQSPDRRRFFETNNLLIPYIRDECEKIRRLQGALKDQDSSDVAGSAEDYRSALLRAAGLYELLLKARWVKLWQSNLVTVCDQNSGRSVAPQDFYEAVLEYESAGTMRLALADANPKLYLKLTALGKHCKARPMRPRAPVMREETGSGIDGERLIVLRNQTIHLYLAIPQAVAQAAYDLVANSVADFVTQWAALDGQPIPPPGSVNALPWKEVCNQCGLNFLPLQYREFGVSTSCAHQ